MQRAQLERLAAASERPNITVLVLPFTAAAHAALAGGPVVLLGFPDPSDPGMVYIEHQTGATYLEEPTEIASYTHVLNQLRALALPPDDSRKRIRDVAAAL